MDDRYLFDKRFYKKYIKKYALFFVLIFIATIVLNVQLQKFELTNGIVVLLDVLFIFVAVILYELLLKLIKDRKNKNEITIKQKDKSVITVKNVKSKKSHAVKNEENVIIVEDNSDKK